MKHFLFTSAILIYSIVLNAQVSNVKFEINDSLIFINDIEIPNKPSIDFFINILGETSRIKKETRKNTTDNTKSKWEIFYFDNAGIKITKSIDNEKLITLEISYSNISKTSPKELFKGTLIINGIFINQRDAQLELQKKLSDFEFYSALGFCLISNEHVKFTASYNPWAEGIQYIGLRFRNK